MERPLPSTMDSTQLELFADEVRRVARIGADENADAVEFVLRLMGDEAIVVVDRLAVGARLVRGPNGYRIELRDDLPDINFACAHEFAHWALRELAGYRGPDEERCANHLGAALLAPRGVVRAAVAQYDGDFGAVRPLARALRMSQTSAQLRLSEVLHDERGVVTKSGNIIARNQHAVDWADPRILDVRKNKRYPGLASARLRGGIDQGRYALLVR